MAVSMLERRLGRAGLIVAIAAGILAGVGAYTFRYAEGLSYFSEDPRACMNCHIMQPQFDSWQKSSHHAVATCVDCHLPHTFPAKYIAKAENGYHHSKAFTLQDFDEPIMIKEKNAAILQDNCVDCHQGLVHELISEAAYDQGTINCVHCHRSVGHGPTAGLGAPESPLDLERTLQ